MASFGDTLLACHTSLYRYARALAHDAAVAEELVQEAYRRALSSRKCPYPLTEETVRPWLFTILRNYWNNELRRLRVSDQRELSEDTTPVNLDTPDAILARRLLQSEIRYAVEALPETLREVIVLREIENMSYAEIAALLECPAGTVMSRLARARASLRQMLASHHTDHKAHAKGAGL